MRKLFFGGIHPSDKKNLTSDQGVTRISDPEYVVIPMRQHIGAPCSPLVKVGDPVLEGQKIGDGEGLCVPVHASVSGTVTAIEERPHMSGTKMLSVVIQNDGEHRTCEDALLTEEELDKLTAHSLFQIIREAGIVGMGGATFPTDVKAVSSLEKIDTLLINACECEPYITADDMLMRRWPERVFGGIEILAKALQPKHIVIAVEENKPEAIAALRSHESRRKEAEIRVLPTRYPQGAEKQLIKTVTGREVPPGKLPVEVSCAVFNVSTAAAVYRAVALGRPLTRRIVTVTGESIRRPQNFIVPIGTPFSHLIEQAGGLKEDAGRVIAGGPMMGFAQSTLEVPVTKGSGCVLCLPAAETVKHPSCIRCGACVEACPMHLQPLYLYRYQKAGDLSALKKLNLMDCVECGCCAYVCPGKLPLVEQIRAGKRAIREENTK